MRVDGPPTSHLNPSLSSVLSCRLVPLFATLQINWWYCTTLCFVLFQMLAIACLVLHHYSYDLTDLPTLMLCSGTYVGYVVVLSGEIVGEK